MNNEHYEMIDAQLTTEIFGLFAPTRPDLALKMSELPIRTVARKEAQWIVGIPFVRDVLVPDRHIEHRAFGRGQRLRALAQPGEAGVGFSRHR